MRRPASRRRRCSGLGFAHHEAGQHALSAAAFDELLKLQAVDRRLSSNAAHMRAVSLQLAGNTDEAVAAYNAGLEQFALRDVMPTSEDDIEAATNAYRCGKGAVRLLRELGRIEEADAAYASTYTALIALPPDRQTELDRFINEWALLSYENRRFDRSDELFELLIEKCPDSDLADEARLYLAEGRYFAGQVDEGEPGFSSSQTIRRRTISSGIAHPCCSWTSPRTASNGISCSSAPTIFGRNSRRARNSPTRNTEPAKLRWTWTS